MPVEDGEYVKLTEDQIRDAIEAALQDEFGNDIDLTDSSVFAQLAEVMGTVLSVNQEQSLQEVYQSAFLDTATGVDLERVVAIVGIQRRDAIHATGAERFISNKPVQQSFNIQNGTEVQTGGEDPITFETTEQKAIKLIDSLEDNDIAEYSGQTGDFNTTMTDADVYDGNVALEGTAVDGSHIYNDNITLEQGATNHVYLKPTSNTAPAVTFFVQSDDDSDYYQIVLDNSTDELRLERVDNGSVAATLDTASGVGSTAGEYHHVEWDTNLTEQINVTLYDKDENELATLGASDSTYTRGFPGFKSEDANGLKYYDLYTQSEVSANIRATDGGTSGNVGPNSITNAPSLPAGVDSITNLYPTGDTTYEDTDQNQYVPGRDEETDADLRERARDAVSEGGDATHDAIVSTLVNDVDGVTSVTVFENKTDTDNTGSGGLPPHAFEAVVFGGQEQAIADAIFGKKAVTARDYGGANGTTVTRQVTADSNGQQFDITFSRPTKVEIDITLDIITNDNYVGDDAIRDQIVRYIGGVLSDGDEVEGLGVGEDVFVDEIRDIVIDPDANGVPALDQDVDGDPVETTPAATIVNGIEVVDIGSNEVAQSDATDASITINTREI
jgi:uncharacterized phage protein gp47/JayE